MIQRIQSVYILLVMIANAISLFFAVGKHDISVVLLFAVSAVLALIAVFRYKNRKSQFVINRLNILLNLILLGVFAYRVLSTSGEGIPSEKGVEVILPLFSIVFLFFANRAIKRDEDLVKSVDRLR